MGCFDDMVIKTVDNMLHFNYVDADEISLIMLVNWAHNDKYNCNIEYPNLYKVSVRVTYNDEEVRINTESELVSMLEQPVGNEEKVVGVKQNITVNQNITAEDLTVAGENIAADENMVDFGDREVVNANDIVVDEMFSYVEVDGNTELLEIEEDVVESSGDNDGSTNRWDHNEAIAAIKKLDVKAFQWFSDIDTKLDWKDKKLAYVNLIGKLAKNIHEEDAKMRTKCTRWSTELPPVVHRTLEKLRQEGRSMQVLSTNDFEFEILDEFDIKWVVDFRYHTCGYGAWQLSGLPCKHSMTSLSHKRGDIQTQHAMNKNPHFSHNISNNPKSLKDRVLTVFMLAGGGYEQHI
ncbi:hypothetical protein QYF36_004678 [Acer negundo]|nr:hypothetical protein QYF36_004678 [Acer negundo]